MPWSNYTLQHVNYAVLNNFQNAMEKELISQMLYALWQQNVTGRPTNLYTIIINIVGVVAMTPNSFRLNFYKPGLLGYLGQLVRKLAWLLTTKFYHKAG